MRHWVLLAAITLGGLLPLPAQQEPRAALVVGNGAYREAPLRNPVNDARALSASLRRCGFRVVLLENATREQMRTALRTFGDTIRHGGVGLFYFAGHGMQVKGRNYLIPVGADIAREDEVAGEALDTESVFAKLESAGNRLNILILDACRNNPFGRSFRSSSAGLAQMDAPKGTYIAFATAPGRTAADGAGIHGLYTQHLLANLEVPGLRIEDVFKRVRAGVLKASSDQQMPWDSSSLTGDFYFVPGPGRGIQVTPILPPATSQASPETPRPPESLRTTVEDPDSVLNHQPSETSAEFAQRLKDLGRFRLGKGYLIKDRYNPDARRLPVHLGLEPWAAIRQPAHHGRMEVELGPAELSKLLDEGLDHWVQGCFRAKGGGAELTELTLVTPTRRLSLLLPTPTPPKAPRPGQVWFDPIAGMEFCWIPPGSFTMGSPSDEPKRSRNEGPRREVTFSRGFWMGRCEVTQHDYNEIARAWPSRFRGPNSWSLPVEQVSWNDAQAFVKALNGKAGPPLYRLPSEAEWEYACRAGTTTSSTVTPIGAAGWSSWNSGQLVEPLPGIKVNSKYATHPVGSLALQGNPWNLHDMGGNVAEWCQDIWHSDYTGAPFDGRAWLEGGDSGKRVIRGGDYDHTAWNMRSAWRDGEKADRKVSTIGFRVVREAGP